MGKKMKGLESGTANVITDTNGDGTLAISFENPMDYDDFAVALAANENDITAIPFVTNKTVNGFDVNVDAATIKSTEVINTSSPNLTFNDNTEEVIDASGNQITFGDADPDTIVRNSGDWRLRFVAGDFITVADDSSNINAGTYEIDTVAALTITLVIAEALTGEVNSSDTFTFTVVTPTLPSNIVRAAGNWETLFGVGDVITITGSDDNDGAYTITAVATVTMTFTLADDVMVQDTQTSGSVTLVTNDGIDIGWIAKQNRF